MRYTKLTRCQINATSWLLLSDTIKQTKKNKIFFWIIQFDYLKATEKTTV